MKRRLLIAVVVFVVTNVWAQDPWKKSYKNWDAQDVRKILNDSPWSRLVEVERKEKKHSLDAPAGAPTVAGVREEEDEDEQEEGKEKDDSRERSEKGKKKEDVKFLVRWVSSSTLREASVRGQVLQGRIAEADEDKALPPAADDYEVALVGSDMRLFNGADESTLKEKTFLIAKKSKQKVTSSQVEIVRAADGKRINAILFHFPKKSPSGQAVVGADEKELRFLIGMEAMEVKASFDLQQMIDPQGLDL